MLQSGKLLVLVRCFAWLLVLGTLKSQPFTFAEWRGVTFTDPASTISVLTDVFYPGTPGTVTFPNTPNAFVGTGQYPVVMFLHGCCTPKGTGYGVGAYTDIGRFLAKQGYIVIAYDDEAIGPVTNPNLAHEVMFNIAKFIGESVYQTVTTATGSHWQAFTPHVNLSRMALMGHSMGGGNVVRILGSQNATFYQRFKTGCGVAPWNYDANTGFSGFPGTTAFAPYLSVPMLYISGGADDAVGPGSSSPAAVYDLYSSSGTATPFSRAKFALTLQGFKHAGFIANQPGIEFPIGGWVSGYQPALVAWFQTFLEDKPASDQLRHLDHRFNKFGQADMSGHQLKEVFTWVIRDTPPSTLRRIATYCQDVPTTALPVVWTLGEITAPPPWVPGTNYITTIHDTQTGTTTPGGGQTGSFPTAMSPWVDLSAMGLLEAYCQTMVNGGTPIGGTYPLSVPLPVAFY